MHFKKLFSLCFMVIFFLTSCEKDDTPSNSIVKENFSAPDIISAKQHFDANIKLPQNPNNSFQKKANSLKADWNNSKVDVYKKTSTQDVDILYTPVYLNTQANVKAFVASVEQNGQVDSKIFLMLYKKNPFGDNGLSTYTFIYGLDGKLENAYNLEDGLVVPFDTQSSNGTDQSSSQKTANTVDCNTPPIDGDFNDMLEYLEACNGMLDEVTVVAPGQNTIDPGPFSGGGLISDGPTWPGFDGSPFDGGDPFNAGGGFHAVNPIPLSPNLVTADPISIALAIDAPLLSQEATFLKAQSIELLQAIADYLNMNKDRDSIDSRFQDQDISNDQVPNIKPEAQNLIHDFISAFNNRSQLSAEAEAFFEEAMTILQNNPSAEVDFEEMYIGFPVPDDDYNYQGPKQKIPNQIVLDTGEVIEVTFVTYTDDNISSDQEVAELLINALKISLENANLNLSESEKISSINVYATTNGEHTGPNHSNGTAIDINRINGERMAMTGLTNQIKEFQIALDNFQYIRENFGPFFKHKYSVEKPSGNRWNYDYPVGGHKDHIHFSVRQ